MIDAWSIALLAFSAIAFVGLAKIGHAIWRDEADRTSVELAYDSALRVLTPTHASPGGGEPSLSAARPTAAADRERIARLRHPSQWRLPRDPSEVLMEAEGAVAVYREMCRHEGSNPAFLDYLNDLVAELRDLRAQFDAD